MQKTLGQVAYEAFWDNMGWKALNGKVMPTWEELNKDQSRQNLVAAWEASAKAVKAS